MKASRKVFLFVSGCAIAALPFCAFVANSAQNDLESPEVSALAATLANGICVSAENMNRQSYARARKSHKDLKMFEETITRRLLAYVDVERDHRSFTEMEASVVGMLAERPSVPVMLFCVSHLDYSAEMKSCCQSSTSESRIRKAERT